MLEPLKSAFAIFDAWKSAKRLLKLNKLGEPRRRKTMPRIRSRDEQSEKGYEKSCVRKRLRLKTRSDALREKSERRKKRSENWQRLNGRTSVTNAAESENKSAKNESVSGIWKGTRDTKNVNGASKSAIKKEVKEIVTVTVIVTAIVTAIVTETGTDVATVRAVPGTRTNHQRNFPKKSLRDWSRKPWPTCYAKADRPATDLRLRLILL
jgi:hypothetical protein